MKVISYTKLSDTLAMTECKDGFWLYDTTCGMNLAMRAKTRDAAFVEALSYYQRRLAEVTQEYVELNKKVNSFLIQFQNDEDEDSD